MKSTHFKWKMIMIHTDRTLKLYFKKKKDKAKGKYNHANSQFRVY